LGAVSRYFPWKFGTRDLVSYNQRAFFTQALTPSTSVAPRRGAGFIPQKREQG